MVMQSPLPVCKSRFGGIYYSFHMLPKREDLLPPRGLLKNNGTHCDQEEIHYQNIDMNLFDLHWIG